MTPSPTEVGRKIRNLKLRGKKQQKATMNLSQLVASTPDILPTLAAFCHRQLPEFVAICGAVSSHFNFHLLATTILAG
jgi:hypothetical protein